jgi:hypothetical protein
VTVTRFSELSAPRQTLVRRCQQVGFGKILGLVVRESEPVFVEQTEVLIDLKLDGDDGPRRELDLEDFAVSAEIIRLLSNLDAIGNGTVEEIEIRAGVPRRMIVKAPLLMKQ